MSLQFNASGESATRTTNLPSITAFTIMAWVKIGVDRNTYASFFSFGSGGFYYYAGTLDTGIDTQLYNGDSTVSGSALATGTWAHIAMTCSGTAAGNLLGYFNGSLDITHAGQGGYTAGTVWIGNDGDDHWFNGSIAAVKIYNAVLSQAQIAAEKPYWQPQLLTNLNSYFPCTDNATLANNLIDANGGGANYNLTANGSLSIDTTYPSITAGPAGGRTSKNTRAFPLGLARGQSLGIAGS